MNWAQFKDPPCYLCLASAVVAIYGSKGSTKARTRTPLPHPGIQILSFSCSFRQKNCKIIG